MSNLQQEKHYKELLQKAYNRIQELQQEVDSLKSQEPIAIIGMGCRFPGGATSPALFWNILENGVDTVQEIPQERWDVERYYDSTSTVPGRMSTRYGAFLNDIDTFDASFFEISPREATWLDPQQRLLLEVSWQALENAGLNPSRLRESRTGTFIGIGVADYERTMGILPIEEIDGYCGTGVVANTACGRLSYFYGFHAPSLAVDTACSSSLVCAHLAIQSLNNGESDLALVGGVQVLLDPRVFVVFSNLNALSADGRCKAFAANADGYGRGEGCGIVVLKRLADAQREGDAILAIITGSAVSHGGKSSGLTVPNESAQADVLQRALEKAGVSLHDVDYLETHGTGTSLGDPIEVQALAKVFKKRTQKLGIGSVKSNIAHLEAGAGIASLIKVVLSLKHGLIPPSLHANPLNPYIGWDEIPIEVVQKRTPWQKSDKPRIAGISSFGIGGTLAHLLVQEPPEIPEAVCDRTRSSHILAISAKDTRALTRLVERYQDHVSQTQDDIRDICYTANISRSSLDKRIAFVGLSREDFGKKFSQYLKTPPLIHSTAMINKNIVFLFTGQGSQYVGMGKELYGSSPVFTESLDRCNGLFQKYIGRSISELLYAENATESSVNQAIYTQPVIFSIQYALRKLWQSWGVTPYLVVGHSIGEYAAAQAAGIFTLEDAVKIVAARGKIMQSVAEEGKMVGVLASETDIQPFLTEYKDSVSIAVVNTPENITISGSNVAIEQVLKTIKQAKIFVEPLNISHAFHSILMKPYVETFKKELEGVSFSPPKLPIIADITGKRAHKEICTPEYWASHICSTIRFYDCLKTLESEGYHLFLEIGGTATLTGLVGQYITDENAVFLPSLRPGVDAWRQMLTSLADLYQHGYPIDWDEFEKPYSRRKVSLPTYPFQRERYWFKEIDDAYFDSLHSVDWEEKELETPIELSDRTGKAYFIFSDSQGLGDRLEEILTQSGATCFKITKSSIDPESKEKFRTLFKNKRFETFSAGVILFLWGIETVDSDSTTADILMEEQKLMCGSLLNIVQTTFELHLHEKLKLWIITRNAQWIEGASREIAVSQSTLWGFGRELDLEVSDFWGGIIDIDNKVMKESPEMILQEIDTAKEEQIAFREDGRRFVIRANNLHIQKQQPTIRFKPDRTYLITGGLGALGLFFAEWMIRKGARHIVLNGRRPPKAEAQETIETLNREGANIVVICGDVAQEGDVNRIFTEIDTTLPQLAGIFHAAGTNLWEMVINHSWEKFSQTLKPKVQGTWNLHKATEDRELDFMVLFTTAATIMGVSGRIDYVAGNSFLNAVGWYRRSKNVPIISLNWGLWSQIGMAAKEKLAGKSVEGLGSAIGVYTTKPTEGLKLMELILCQDLKEPYIMVVDWLKYRNFMPVKQRNGIFSRLCRTDEVLQEVKVEDRIVEELHGARPKGRRKLFIPYIQQTIAKVMGFSEDEYERVLIDKPLMDQGVDSLMGLQFRNNLNKVIDAELPATLLFNYPTVVDVVDHILNDVISFEEMEKEMSEKVFTSEALKDFEDVLKRVDFYNT